MSSAARATGSAEAYSHHNRTPAYIKRFFSNSPWMSAAADFQALAGQFILDCSKKEQNSIDGAPVSFQVKSLYTVTGTLVPRLRRPAPAGCLLNARTMTVLPFCEF